MSRRRALIVCPGRGSYDRAGLGQLQDRPKAARQIVEACDEWRTSMGRPTLTELDSADAYRSSKHVAGEHASLLTAGCAWADLADLNREKFEIVGVCGNSMGWYTALAIAGALPQTDAIRLVDTMGWYQKGNVVGGQVLYPLTDSSWAYDDALAGTVEQVLADICAEGHYVGWSIRLGGYAVLGGDKAGVKLLLERLPKQQRGSRAFPIQLPMHSAFHTPLLQGTSTQAFSDLSHLSFQAPNTLLINGNSQVFRPGWADLAQIRDYTLGQQVVAPYDFPASVKTALSITAPDVVIALGPGNSLGGPLARILVNANWQGVRNRADFDVIQKSRAPMLLSFGVSMQRKALL